MNKLNIKDSLILIVDDVSENVQFIGQILSIEGYSIAFALSGKEALEVLEHIKPDLILLDLFMPDLDGIEVCSTIKNNPKTADIPVIFLTGAVKKEYLAEAFKVGAVDYITKPFDMLELLLRIECQLKIYKQEIELKKTIDELNRSNQDLEQFARTVSHDLQQPIQLIMGFGDLIQRRYKDTLDPQVINYFQHIYKAAISMKGLIQGLLSYAKVHRQNNPITEVNCNQILGEVLDNLKLCISEKQAQVDYDLLPTLQGNRSHLIQLFQNLISNAIKFSRSDFKPEIKISVQQNSDHWLFSIQDNGRGIEQNNWENVFSIFERLQSDDSIPGMGIGLATCKKIVELYGGKIWLTSKVNEGSTFYFTLPCYSS